MTNVFNFYKVSKFFQVSRVISKCLHVREHRARRASRCTLKTSPNSRSPFTGTILFPKLCANHLVCSLLNSFWCVYSSYEAWVGLCVCVCVCVCELPSLRSAWNGKSLLVFFLYPSKLILRFTFVPWQEFVNAKIGWKLVNIVKSKMYNWILRDHQCEWVNKVSDEFRNFELPRPLMYCVACLPQCEVVRLVLTSVLEVLVPNNVCGCEIQTRFQSNFLVSNF